MTDSGEGILDDEMKLALLSGFMSLNKGLKLEEFVLDAENRDRIIDALISLSAVRAKLHMEISQLEKKVSGYEKMIESGKLKGDVEGNKRRESILWTKRKELGKLKEIRDWAV